MSPFKAYDIRGRVPDQLNDDIAYAIGRAYAELIRPGSTVVGYDIRLSSPGMAEAVTEGLLDGGSDVHAIGMCGTEEVYHATEHFGHGGGIMVTASHNPIDYNGLKLVREGSRPISGDSGLKEIEARVAQGSFAPATRGTRHILDARPAYIEHLLGYVDGTLLKPLKIVVNPGNGGAGVVLDALEPQLPLELIRLHAEPDGTFPNGIPNPLLTENRAATSEAVLAHGADLGLAWDGDFDRCFFFDEQGRFIEGYYLVGLLAERLLAKEPGGKIIHDPRLTWNTLAQVEAAGGTAVQCKSGHAFIKERMRAEDALYGGEMSAHHYFRDFAYCDSGMIPWLLVAEQLSVSGQPLSTLVDKRIAAYPCSGEINYEVDDTAATIDRVLEAFAAESPRVDRTDGVSVEFADWRFNLRGSNTEPVIRLNVETRADPARLAAMTERLSQLITTQR
ncbi:MAG: phosphomannomutase [Gammaproteobacteria bacterium]|nr:MAG: phosphomannomutase [Gammaproteobacteria bacterium]